MSIVIKVHFFLSRINKTYLILIIVAFNLISSVFTSFISKAVSGKMMTENAVNFRSLMEEIFIGLLLAPLLETFFIQYAIIESFKSRLSKVKSIIISASVFGLLHFYNPFYLVYGFLAGLSFGYIYLISKSAIKGLLYTFLTHLLYNSIVFTLLHI